MGGVGPLVGARHALFLTWETANDLPLLDANLVGARHVLFLIWCMKNTCTPTRGIPVPQTGFPQGAPLPVPQTGSHTAPPLPLREPRPFRVRLMRIPADLSASMSIDCR